MKANLSYSDCSISVITLSYSSLAPNLFGVAKTFRYRKTIKIRLNTFSCKKPYKMAGLFTEHQTSATIDKFIS